MLGYKVRRGVYAPLARDKGGRFTGLELHDFELAVDEDVESAGGMVAQLLK